MKKLHQFDDLPPCLLNFLRCCRRRRRRRRLRSGGEQLQWGVRELPSIRERDLSQLALCDDESACYATDQSQSMLLTKLPIELRALIFQYALGGNFLHIFKISDKPRPGCLPCRFGPDVYSAGHYCWQAATTLPVGVPVRGARPPDKNEYLLALPRTCRQVYAESISFLYAYNSFDFQNRQALLAMHRSILPCRFQSIRSIQFFADVTTGLVPCWPDPPEDQESWNQVWRVISSMQGLDNITVSLYGGQHMDPQERQILYPMMGVKGVRRFEVYRGENASEVVLQELSNPPFVVICVPWRSYKYRTE